MAACCFLLVSLLAVTPAVEVVAPRSALLAPNGPELRLGMSRAEVLDLVGTPERTEFGAAEYLSAGFAVLYDSAKRVSGVVAGQSTEPGPLSEAFLGSIGGIVMGSSRLEVEILLGAPTHVQLQGAAEFLTYPAQGLALQLADGRVHHITLVRPRNVASKCSPGGVEH